LQERRLALSLFGIVSAILFHPLWTGEMIVGGTDTLYAHYPNLLFGLRSFHEFHSFTLWNPYIFAGFDFTHSIHAHFLNPIWMPLLLLPERFAFYGVTVAFLAINWLVAVCWYRIARLYLDEVWFAILVGIVAQAGMFFWFLVTTFIGVPMYLLSSTAVYVVLSFERRSAFRNYLCLSFLLALLFIHAHPIYLVGFSLPIVGAFLVKGYPGYLVGANRRLAGAFVGAGLTGLAAALYRLVPVISFLAEQGVYASELWIGAFRRHGYFLMTEFIPQAIGITVYESQRVSGALEGAKLGPYHAQAHNGLYFGIFPLIIAYVAARKSGDSRIVALAFLYLLLTFVPQYLIQPLSDIVGLLILPITLDVVFRITATFTLLFFLIFSAGALRMLEPAALRAALREIALIAVLILMATIVLWVLILHEQDPAMSRSSAFLGLRLWMIAALVGMFVLWIRGPKAVVRVFGSWGALILGLLATVGTFYLAVQSGLLPADELTTRDVAIVLGSLPLILIGVWLAGCTAESLSRSDYVLLSVGFVFIVLAVVVPLPARPVGRVPDDVLLSAALGACFFSLLVLAAMRLLNLVASGKRSIFTLAPLIVTITVGDLVAMYTIYSYVNIPTPFVAGIDQIYRKTDFAARLEASGQGPAANGTASNLLSNSAFRTTSNQIVGWGFGGRSMGLCPNGVEKQSDGANALRLCYSYSDKGGNLYQDTDLHTVTRNVTLGVWMRVQKGAHGDIFMVSPAMGLATTPVDAPADGIWHWVTAQLSETTNLVNIRSHINLAAAGEIEVFGPKLVPGFTVRPDILPDDPRNVDYERPVFHGPLDLDDYRANDPQRLSGIAPGEGLTNLSEIARIPTYGGVDSDMPADLVQFVTSFVPADPAWYNRGGIIADLKDDRLLDLFGVAYDLGKDGEIIHRSNALARFSAFNRYQVIRSFPATLARLRSATFDPATQVLIDRVPTTPVPAGKPRQFVPLHYLQTKHDTLVLAIEAGTPRIVLFDDHYSPSWVATWNGAPLPVMRANGIFMAVALPEGAGTLRMCFDPVLFYHLADLAAAIGAGLFVALLVDLARTRPRRMRSHGAA